MAHSIDGKEIILLGDMTTHGGKVMTASGTLTCMGIPVARVGDMVFCPLCKGMFPIVEGAQTALDNGKKIARHGDMEEICSPLKKENVILSLRKKPIQHA